MLCIAWTTVAERADAERLASDAVGRGFAVCVQIDGPIASIYQWQGKIEQSQEFRLAFKCIAERVRDLENYVLQSHPYEIPEWVVVRAEHVGEKYLSWASANSSNPPL